MTEINLVQFGPGGQAKKRVVIRGGLLTQSGYGVHTRQICRYLLSKDNVDLIAQPTQWGMTPWSIRDDMENGLVGELMRRSRGQQPPYDVSVQVQLPNEWDPRLAQFNVGVTAGIETDRCNPEWVDAVNRMNKVIVPSEHSARVIREAGHVTTPLEVIPESFPDVLSASDIKPADIELENDFNFLLVGQFTGNTNVTDRKNIAAAISWLCQEFSKDEVGIVIKANMGRNTKIDRQVTMKTLEAILAQCPKDRPPVHLVHGYMNDDEMAGLYHHPKIKAYVTSTRGEGYGLPILEAAACDVPVVATDWSGHLDFMSKGKFIKLAYQLVDVDKRRIDGKLFMPGSRWAEVLEPDFKKKVRKLYESYSTPREWAKELGKKLRDEYSFEAIAKLYEASLGGVL